MNAVERYYDQDSHVEWERLDRHRTEFAVTIRAFHEYLPKPPASIIDIGGGPVDTRLDWHKKAMM